MTEPARATWVEVDLDAVAHNVRVTCDLVGPGVKVFACVKADAYGLGLLPVARAAAEGGAYGLAVADAADIVTLRRGGLSLPVLLYAGALPEQAAAVAALDNVIATVHDAHSLAAFVATRRTVTVFLKISCGGGRYGYTAERLGEVLEALQRSPNLRLAGLYTNLSSPADRAFTHSQGEQLLQAQAEARRHGFADLELLAGSSRVLIDYPQLRFRAVDPGRMLLGFLGEPWQSKAPLRPVLSAVKSRVAQIQEYSAGSLVEGVQPSGDPMRLTRDLRLAVLPIGYGDGFNSGGPLGEALIEGRRVRIAGPLGIESMVLDVSEVAQARVGSEVVLLGEQGSQRITLDGLAASMGMPMSELLFRLTHRARKVYR